MVYSPMESELKHSPANTAADFATAADKDKLPLLKPNSNPSDAPTVTSESIEELEKKYAAYVRNDAYGTMGRGELPLDEKVMLGFALITLVPLRLVIGILILVVYYLICLFCTLFKDPNRGDEQGDYAHLSGWRRDVVLQCGRWLSRAMLFNFGFYWLDETRRDSLDENDRKEQLDESERPRVIVSNHVSYLDVLYHMSSSFPSFVAKRSVGKHPLVGLLRGNDRKHSRSSPKQSCSNDAALSRYMFYALHKLGRAPWAAPCASSARDPFAPHMCLAPFTTLFPTGPVFSRYVLFGDDQLTKYEDKCGSGAAFNKGGHGYKWRLPSSFQDWCFSSQSASASRYFKISVQKISPAWDTISGVRHVFLLLCQFVNYIEVIRLPVYYPSKQEKNDPKLYASNVRTYMAAEGNLILSDIGLPEKRVYHAALNGNSLPRGLHQKDD